MSTKTPDSRNLGGLKSRAATNHRLKLRRQLILRLLDKLERLDDLLPPEDPQREAVVSKIERWNLELQVED